MNITLLAADLAQNSLGRVILLAQALSFDHKVQIIGPCFSSHIWQPAEGCGVEIARFPGETFPRFASVAARMLRSIGSGPVIACKPLLPSFGVALLCRRLKGNPVIVDVDDDELAMTAPGRQRPFLRQLRDPLSHWYTKKCWSAVPTADGVFSIASHYQKQFGGVVIPHAKDTHTVDPDLFDRASCRRDLGLPADAEVIAFVGTPRAHKGIDLIVDAMVQLHRPNLFLLLVGAQPDDQQVHAILARLEGKVAVVPPQPTSSMPKFLAAASLVVLPQRGDSAGSGQVPAKLFDAMAMGIPIVASAVGDIPRFLGDAGVLVPPDDQLALSLAIQQVLNEPTASRAMGRRARSLCIGHYSFDAIRPMLNAGLERAIRAIEQRRSNH